jgi:hypothetical protein
MKKFTAFVLLLIFALSFSNADAQSKKKPFVIFDVIGGYNLPLMDMGGSIKGVFDFSGYGTSNAIGTGFNVKFSVLTRDMFQLRVYGAFLYTQAWSSEGNAYLIGGTNGNNEIVPGWPSTYYSYPVITGGESYMRLNIPSAGVGCEAAVYTDKDSRSSFNFGLDADMSIITGRAYNTYSNREVFYTIPSTVRFGLGLNVMYDIKVAEFLGINVGTRFQWHNLLGKSSKSADENWYMPLNDDAVFASNYSSSSRNIATLNFFTGVSFFIGKR